MSLSLLIKDADSLSRTDDEFHGAVVAALQALDKEIHQLRKRVAELEAAEAGNTRAANVASCLANGILPD